MNRTALTLILEFLLLVPAQAVLFNNLTLFNVAIPLVFIYIIISLPITLGINWCMTIGFATGLAVDILSDTPGLNAFACTLLAFARGGLFHLYMPSDADLADQSPSIRNMGLVAYLKYALTAVAFYCLVVFTVEALQVWQPALWLLRILASTLFTFILIYAIASLSSSARNEKRL